jgi:hypothetical protein
MQAKGALLHDELRNVVAQNPEALAALMNVGTVRQSFDSEKARRCEGRALFCRRH